MPIAFVKDGEFDFLTQYLNDKGDNYSCLSENLINFVQTKKDILRINKTYNLNQKLTLTELVEYASIELKDFLIIKKLSNGGWSDNYLVAKGEPERPVKRFLKIVKQNIFNNENVDRIIAHHDSPEATLEKLSDAESRINELTSSTSEDMFPNFDYRPLPQFFGREIVDVNGKQFNGLVYEFIKGTTLNEYFSEKRSLGDTLKIFAKTAYSLNYVHQKGYTHNDIKGDNFMVGVNGRVYLLDLAFSKLAESDYTLRGVAAYTAPERIMGGTLPTEKSDQYSLGVVFYEKLTGQLPCSYEDTNNNKSMFVQKIHNGELRPKHISELNPNMDKKLAEIFMKMVSYDPKDRFDSMQEVENKLVSFLSQYQLSLQIDGIKNQELLAEFQ